MINPIKNYKNLIRNFKNLIFILQYIFDISFFGIGIVINIIIFLFHCYHSNKGFKLKLKQIVKGKVMKRYIRKKTKYQKIRNFILKKVAFK